ncbi:DEAD/DEAH box helicase [Bacillus sp. FJAT-29937]|uniref:DEAD/DEAH box helicase n=1 Tax=Bacillus sp. FJAT-29937 TaxID=1720553 RepID=UPI000835870D|nr:DEAD/DEAH box helicase [Bacillus sp. FJAT-29937]
MTKMIYHSKGIDFKTNNLLDSITKNECMVHSSNHEKHFSFTVTNKNGEEKTVFRTTNPLSWHFMIKNNYLDLKVNAAVEAMENWGFDVSQSSISKTQEVLDSKYKQYLWNKKALEEVRHTQQFQKALEMVEMKYGGPLSDGRKLFPYQKEAAAFLIAKKRLLLGFEMGLGKTITSLVGTTADETNKKILIITMSRNVNDWIREIKLLGLEDDYVFLQNPRDLHSNKRIHLVSYEKWANDRIKFINIIPDKCPDCDSTLNFDQHLQYCFRCKEKAVSPTISYSLDSLPEKCPCCKKEWKKKKLFCSCGFTVVKARKKPLFTFFHRGYDASIVDEGHYLKNGNSNRSKSIVRKVKTKTRVILTGTPAENGSEDLYWPLVWLTGCGSHFEDPLFREPFTGYGKVGEENFRTYYGGGSKRTLLESDNVKARVSHHEELWDLLDSLMIRKTQQDKDVKDSIKVPEPVHIRRHLELTEADRSLYEDILQQFRTWYQEEHMKRDAALARGDKYRINSIEVCTWLNKLRQAASCPWTFKEYKASKSEQPTKIRFLIEKAKSYLRAGKKMLIFTSHKATAEQLGVLLDGILPGKQAGYIHGSVDMKYRFELMDRFQNPNDNLSILIMTTKTGAESYTLTEAKAVFLFDLDWNAKKIQQCYSRAVRLGQRSIVDIYWLISVGTIDSNMHSLILSKLSGVDLAIDRKELDFSKIAMEFEGDESIEPENIDYEAFAAEMLSSGTKSSDVYSA